MGEGANDAFIRIEAMDISGRVCGHRIVVGTTSRERITGCGRFVQRVMFDVGERGPAG
jgi:hypothetical protein